MTKRKQELIAGIAADIELRVGRVGSCAVTISAVNQRYESIGLSRGGVVVPRLSDEEHYEAARKLHVYQSGPNLGEPLYPNAPDLVTPSHNPDLTVISHLVGNDGDEGRRSGDVRAGIVLDNEGSQKYVLLPDASGRWRAFDAFDQARNSSIPDISVYHLDAARPIEAREEIVFIGSLVTAFDNALSAQREQAVAGELLSMTMTNTLRT